MIKFCNLKLNEHIYPPPVLLFNILWFCNFIKKSLKKNKRSAATATAPDEIHVERT